jgi:hypothetical protein
MKIPGLMGKKKRIYVSHYLKEVEHSSNRKIFETLTDN